MSRILISIIIPVYNHAKELQKTLESVFEQTLLKAERGWARVVETPRRGVSTTEVIIVNDGSTDNIEEVLSKFVALTSVGDPGLKPRPQIQAITQPHLGASAARNRGFKESTGQYVIFWDADIVARPEMLEKMLAELENHPEASYVYSSFKFGWKTFRCGSFDAARLKKFNYITTTSLIRREHFPGFDESLKKFQDWDLWLTMLEQGKTGRWIDEVLFQVKPRRRGMSSWLPAFVYKFPWLPILALKKYNYWKKVVLKKHGLGGL